MRSVPSISTNNIIKDDIIPSEQVYSIICYIYLELFQIFYMHECNLLQKKAWAFIQLVLRFSQSLNSRYISTDIMFNFFPLFIFFYIVNKMNVLKC